jgi:hypothetical protein
MDSVHVPVDPPIVDQLYFNAKVGAFVITFIPADIASRQEKEEVKIEKESEDGRRIQMRMERIEKVIGIGRIERLVHRGDGDFGFFATDGRQWSLSDPASDNAVTQEIYVHLQDLGMIAQIAFRQSQLVARTGLGAA